VPNLHKRLVVLFYTANTLIYKGFCVLIKNLSVQPPVVFCASWWASVQQASRSKPLRRSCAIHKITRLPVMLHRAMLMMSTHKVSCQMPYTAIHRIAPVLLGQAISCAKTPQVTHLRAGDIHDLGVEPVLRKSVCRGLFCGFRVASCPVFARV
jgi:hypothetical protein